MGEKLFELLEKGRREARKKSWKTLVSQEG